MSQKCILNHIIKLSSIILLIIIRFIIRISVMCLGGCPQALQPPNPTIKKCRLILQGLAAGLVIVGIAGIFCQQIFQFFYDLILIYMLYIGWTTFNWCMILIFFIFTTVQTVQTAILFIGMIQYADLFTQKYMAASIYVVLTLAYYPVAVFFSHYVYKHFKNYFQQHNQLFPGNAPQGGNQRGAQNYQRLQQDNTQKNIQTQKKTQDNFFKGQGVKIG